MICCSHAALLTETVEDQKDFDIAQGEGCHYFLGYFFCRPKNILANPEISSNRLNYFRLPVELTREPAWVQILPILDVQP